MSTPGGNGPSGENPYGPPGGSGPGNPYSTPGESGPGAPYGAPNPYGTPAPYGAPNPYGGQQYGATPGREAPLDGISIASLVLSVLCCTGLLGVILGIVGLFRTKGGQRRGRWAAVTGIVVGVLAMAASAGVVALAIYGSGFVAPDDAEVGQCVDIEHDGNSVEMRDKDCAEEHDGEILYVGEYDPEEHGDELEAAVCDTLVPADVQTAIIEEVDDPEYGMVVENLGDEEAGDTFVCYVEGDDLTGSIQ